MKSSWIGLFLCGMVIYLGIVHSLQDPHILLNSHAIILVVGGTIAISLLTYSASRLIQVVDFVLLGFLLRVKNSDIQAAKDLISLVDLTFHKPHTFPLSEAPHPFMIDAFKMIERPDIDAKTLQTILVDQRNAVRRHYFEDAKILNNIAKYPPHLGLLGAASGMIEMMSGLGKEGIQHIGAAMAIALTATLWGVGLNNFVFLPLSDNSQKAAEDEIYFRDIIIECCLQIKTGAEHAEVVRTCLNRLSILDRVNLNLDIRDHQERLKSRNAA